MISLNEYQGAALRTAGDNRGSLAYSMGGVGGEAGEYIDVVKKHLFHGKPESVSREQALKELGDLLWGVAQAADAWGFTLSEVASENIAKLAKRYPNGFSPEAAAARADESPVSQTPAPIAGYSTGSVDQDLRIAAHYFPPRSFEDEINDALAEAVADVHLEAAFEAGAGFWPTADDLEAATWLDSDDLEVAP